MSGFLNDSFKSTLRYNRDALLINSFPVQFARWQIAGAPVTGNGSHDDGCAGEARPERGLSRAVILALKDDPDCAPDL